jgi:LysM repeat protein
VTAYDLIIAMNTLRVSYGLPALIEDPIINAVAQSTAQIMAASEMSWHIGDVSGRLAAAGFGGGSKVWGTENFAVGNQSIDEIMVVWADPDHMIPAVNRAYCNIGAGVATSPSGRTYYVLQAAYTADKACGEYTSVGGVTNPAEGSTVDNSAGSENPGVPGIIVPVKVAQPDAEGKVYHVVEPGQSFWAIAVAYQVTIKDIETWNNISKDAGLQIGQKLFIPSKNTEGYATPTPVGMVQVSTPGADGKIIHVVQPYQTLSTISTAYAVSIDAILGLNGILVDWPLQIGQELLIYPGSITPSPTPRPLTPLEKLTPEADGRYYHTVSSGETLTWIANLYEVTVDELMAWNALTAANVLFPSQKLLLQVTPPATITPTPAPPTATPSFTPATPTATPSRAPTLAETQLAGVDQPPDTQPGPGAWLWVVLGVLVVGGASAGVYYFRKGVP